MINQALERQVSRLGELIERMALDERYLVEGEYRAKTKRLQVLVYELRDQDSHFYATLGADDDRLEELSKQFGVQIDALECDVGGQVSSDFEAAVARITNLLVPFGFRTQMSL